MILPADLGIGTGTLRRTEKGRAATPEQVLKVQGTKSSQGARRKAALLFLLVISFLQTSFLCREDISHNPRIKHSRPQRAVVTASAHANFRHIRSTDVSRPSPALVGNMDKVKRWGAKKQSNNLD